MNLIYQYYVPYEGMDKDMGGVEMPAWARVGMENAKQYARHVGAEYRIDHDRRRPEIDPRLESVRIYMDEEFDKYNTIVAMDLDMLFQTDENIFDIPVSFLGMVHELGVFQGRSNYVQRKLFDPEMGAVVHAEKVLSRKIEVPKSSLYPNEHHRYLNGGLQVWTRAGRQMARNMFLSVYDYYQATKNTEQPYLNAMLAATGLPVDELPQEWNSMDYQWGRFGMGKLSHFLNRTKFRMEDFERSR